MDAADDELYRILKMLSSKKAEKDVDNLYLKLSKMFENFEDLESLEFDKNNEEQLKIFKTCEIILNKKIYSNSFAQV